MYVCCLFARRVATLSARSLGHARASLRPRSAHLATTFAVAADPGLLPLPSSEDCAVAASSSPSLSSVDEAAELLAEPSASDAAAGATSASASASDVASASELAPGSEDGGALGLEVGARGLEWALDEGGALGGGALDGGALDASALALGDLEAAPDTAAGLDAVSSGAGLAETLDIAAGPRRGASGERRSSRRGLTEEEEDD